MRHLGVLALATFILLPLLQAVILSFTATLPDGQVAQGTLGLMNYLPSSRRRSCGRQWSIRWSMWC